MTREEAINEIRSWDFLNEKEIDAIQTLIPELCENEDERTRKRLIDFISDIKRISESGRTTWAVRKGDIEMYNAFLSYLEKQKEQKPTISDEAIRDGVAHFGITQYQIDNWLKKHINIVKQKEQKFDIESIQQSWYMEGYQDRAYNFEPKWIINTGKNGPKYKSNPKYGQPLMKEQKPVTLNEPYNPNEYEVVIEGNATGLKRKEQKPIEDIVKDITENKESAIKFLKSTGIMDDNGELAEIYRSEQKPADYDHEMWKNCEANFEGGKKEVIDHPEKYGLQKEQKPVMIQWTGKNLKEVIDFTGKSPRFREWFKSWDEFESYVHGHGDIFKLFCEDGSHYEVPVSAWIVKTPDGYNIPSRFRFVQKPAEWSEEDEFFRQQLIVYCEKCVQDTLAAKCVDWLKSLRPQPHWKPSEE